jgi:hypothetical protein
MQWWVISLGDKGKQPKEQVKWLGKGSLPYRRCVLYSNDPLFRPFDLFLSFVPLSPNIATAEKSWMGFLRPGDVPEKGSLPANTPPRVPLFFIFYFYFFSFSIFS